MKRGKKRGEAHVTQSKQKNPSQAMKRKRRKRRREEGRKDEEETSRQMEEKGRGGGGKRAALPLLLTRIVPLPLREPREKVLFCKGGEEFLAFEGFFLSFPHLGKRVQKKEEEEEEGHK